MGDISVLEHSSGSKPLPPDASGMTVLQFVMGTPEWPVLDGRVWDGIRTTQIANCPQNAARVIEYQNGVFCLYDNAGNPLGSYLTPTEKTGMGYTVTVQPSREVLGRYGAFFTENPSSVELDDYLFHLSDFTRKLSEQASFVVPPVLMPIEFSYHLYRLLTDNPEREGEMLAFLRDAEFQRSFPSLWSIKTPEQFDSLRGFWQKDPTAFSSLTDTLASLFSASELTEDVMGPTPQQRAFRGRLADIGQAMLRSVIKLHDRPDFSWNIIRQSFRSLQSILEDVHHVVHEPTEPTPDADKLALTAFFTAHADDPDAVAMAGPVAELQWWDKLWARVPADTEVEHDQFYKTMGEDLFVTASETTADTSQELERLHFIIEALIGQGRLPNPLRLLDAGSHTGERILRPLLKWLRGKGGMKVEATGADLMPFAAPQDGAWQFIQADLRDPLFSERVSGPYDLAFCTWSVLNDISYDAQEAALGHLAQTLAPGGVAVIDVPGGYKDEIELYHSQHSDQALGTIERNFTRRDGMSVTKHFFILPPVDLLGLVVRSGLRLLNPAGEHALIHLPPKYTTAQGRQRWMVVAEKVSPPVSSLAGIALQNRA